MGQMCYLCRRKQSRVKGISLHRFPKNPVRREKWLKACDLTVNDDLSYIFICSLHFTAEDIIKGNDSNTRSCLRSNAVPSVGVPNPIKVENEEVTTNTSENIQEELNFYKSEEFDLSLVKSEYEFVNSCPSVKVKEEILEDVESTTSVKSEASCRNSTTSNRRFYEPRYISEITLDDLKTPEKAQRVLNLVLNTNLKNTKRIKSLQDQNRRLFKRISSLEQKISDLKKQSH